MSETCTDAAAVDDSLVLGYHSVVAAGGSKLAVTSTSLHRQLSSLVARGYDGVTFHDAVAGPAGRRRLAVTFDDGELCVLDHALPVLADLRVLGTVFVPVARVGMPKMLTWDDLSLLASTGWEIGSHGITHARVTYLDDAALDEELRGSREAIEDVLGGPCRSLAYPYGAVNARVRDAARRSGYTAACVTRGGLLSADPLCWPRVGIDGRDDALMFRVKTSRAGRMLRGSSLGSSLELAARAARSMAARRAA